MPEEPRNTDDVVLWRKCQTCGGSETVKNQAGEPITCPDCKGTGGRQVLVDFSRFVATVVAEADKMLRAKYGPRSRA
jgi:DnaJ-class molecular chaperone